MADRRRRKMELDGQRRRLRRDGGGSMPVNDRPGRPPVLMLLEDLNPGAEPEPVFGRFPVGFLATAAKFLRSDRGKILHVCSGSLPPGEGIRVDIKPERRPDIVADGRNLPIADDSQDAVLIDPPYTPHYAKELYGTEYPRPAHLLAEAVRVARPCSRIGFVHYIIAKPPKGAQWVLSRGLSVGFGFPMRAFTVFQKDQDSLL